MPKIGFLIFIASLLFQMFFSLVYSRSTFSLNNRFQLLLTRIDQLEITNNTLLVQIATFSALPSSLATPSSPSLLNLYE